MKLHAFWRSGASYRTRIALNLKGLAYEIVPVDIRRGVQNEAAYRALNPLGLVPALETEDGVLSQSPAILEWLEERHPEPPLLPASPADRAEVRAMAAIIGCDMQPLNNLRVLKALRGDLAADEDRVKAWARRWMESGFAALESRIAVHGRGFAFGDRPSLADCYLVPQVYSAERFEVDISAFPHVVAVAAQLNTLPAVAAAHPDRQPDRDL